MAKYIEPTQTEFDAAEKVALDIMASVAPGVLTKAGAVVRELVVRPLSYLFSWAMANFLDTQKRSSIAYLKLSQLRVNPVADAVASNYFVTRRTGTPAQGVVTLTLRSSVTRISQGASFTAESVRLVTAKQILITNTLPSETLDGVLYVKAVASGATFLANIPVVATGIGRIEVAAGTPVVSGFANAAVISAELTSAITGGTDTETDAELMQRAAYNTAESGIGTLNSMRKKLDKAPVNVLSSSVLAGEDAPLFRARYNNTAVNPGGFVDVYAKTQLQASVRAIDTVAARASNTTFSCTLSGTYGAGVFGVASLNVDGDPLGTFTVSFGTLDALGSPAGSRLSVSQTVLVTFPYDTEDAELPVRVTVRYMPGISQLQDFLDLDTERFIGQDIKVKAAVPVAVSVYCVMHVDTTLSADGLLSVKQSIADYINGTEVGARVLNFSDMQKACATTVPGVELRLPCIITASLILRDGSMDYIHSRTGLLDLDEQANLGYWDPAMCFFSITPDKIKLEVL